MEDVIPTNFPERDHFKKRVIHEHEILPRTEENYQEKQSPNYESKQNSGLQEKFQKDFKFNPESDARRITDGIVELAVSLYPYKNADEPTRRRLIQELRQAGDALAYTNQLISLLEQEGGMFDQWKQVSTTPSNIKKRLGERYGI